MILNALRNTFCFHCQATGTGDWTGYWTGDWTGYWTGDGDENGDGK